VHPEKQMRYRKSNPGVKGERSVVTTARKEFTDGGAVEAGKNAGGPANTGETKRTRALESEGLNLL